MKIAPFKMIEVPMEKWRHLNGNKDSDVIRVFQCSKYLVVFQCSKYLVQIRKHRDKVRMAINKVHHTFKHGKPIWQDGITWDELQEIKNQCGFEDCWLCEYYPPKDKVVNVANIRHLWVIPTPKETLND